MAKKTAKALVLDAWREIQAEYPQVWGQVTDLWLEGTQQRSRWFVVVYKGCIYTTGVSTYNVCSMDHAKAMSQLRYTIDPLVKRILQHEQEGKFDRRRQYSVYPGMEC